jgi:GT2 family glycosyltransferase
MKSIILVVLYNRDLETSETLQSLIKNKDVLSNVDIFIWNNTSDPKIDPSLLQGIFGNIDVFYHSDGINTSISKVYNHLIGNYLCNYKYLTILDHDTTITDTFLTELLSAMEQEKANLILPRILSRGKIVSPAKLYFFLGSYYKNIDVDFIKAKHITAINSGMTIRSDYFFESGFRYDENLDFYGTDDDFMISYCKNDSRVQVLRSTLEHDLNYYSDEDVERKAWRFNQFTKGLLYNNRHMPVLKLLAMSYVLILALRESIKYRSLKFFYLKWKN